MSWSNFLAVMFLNNLGVLLTTAMIIAIFKNIEYYKKIKSIFYSTMIFFIGVLIMFIISALLYNVPLFLYLTSKSMENLLLFCTIEIRLIFILTMSLHFVVTNFYSIRLKMIFEKTAYAVSNKIIIGFR